MSESESESESAPRVYKIVRLRARGEVRRRVIRTGLTLAEAQAHCSRSDTRGEGWFDSYTRSDR